MAKKGLYKHFKKKLHLFNVLYRNWRYNEFNDPSSPVGMFRNFRKMNDGWAIDAYNGYFDAKNLKCVHQWTRTFYSDDLKIWRDAENKLIPTGQLDCLVSALKYHGELGF